MRGILASLLFGYAAIAVAGEPVYRYVDPDGVVHYSDRSPDKHAKPIRLAPLSGVTPGSNAGQRKTFYSPEVLRQAARFAVRVESPTPDQRLAIDRAPAVAAASVMPALVRGFHLVYQLDGRSVTPVPVDALSVPLQSLPVGAHELQVILLDDRGGEIARSDVSHFHVVSLKVAGDAPKKG